MNDESNSKLTFPFAAISLECSSPYSTNDPSDPAISKPSPRVRRESEERGLIMLVGAVGKGQLFEARKREIKCRGHRRALRAGIAGVEVRGDE